MRMLIVIILTLLLVGCEDGDRNRTDLGISSASLMYTTEANVMVPVGVDQIVTDATSLSFAITIQRYEDEDYDASRAFTLSIWDDRDVLVSEQRLIMGSGNVVRSVVSNVFNGVAGDRVYTLALTDIDDGDREDGNNTATYYVLVVAAAVG